MFILKLIRIFLPPFHPLKYKWIEYYYGKQQGGYFQEETKYPYTILENTEYIEKYKKKK